MDAAQAVEMLELLQYIAGILVGLCFINGVKGNRL